MFISSIITPFSFCISIAGKGDGINGKKSGLWREVARIAHEVRPPFVFLENSPMLVGRGLAVVIGDLAEMGYDAKWCVLGANDCNAPHERKRLWIRGFNTDKVYADRDGLRPGEGADSSEWQTPEDKQERYGWKHELGAVDVAQRIPSYGEALRILHGMADRMDRLEALGNGLVPIVAASAWRILS